MNVSQVAIVIPAFNESRTISSVINSAKIYGQPIVVNDNSKDDTSHLAEISGAIVINHSENKGYDEAINSGFQKAVQLGFDYIITLDADGQHDTGLLPSLINELRSGTSIVLGVRNSKARLAEHLFSFYTNFRYGIKDPLCGMKGYSTVEYLRFGQFDSYKSIGTELMLRTVASGKPFKQFNLQVSNRIDSSRFGNSFSANLKILRAFTIWILKIY